MKPKDDPLRAKREKAAELMNRALDASFSQGMDPAQVVWMLNRRRDQRYTADSPELRGQPESQLDILIAHYGGSGVRYVW